MQEPHFIIREPLLDAKQQIVGYGLAWQQLNGGSAGADDDELAVLAQTVLRAFGAPSGWALENRLLFLKAGLSLMQSGVYDEFPSECTVLRIAGTDLTRPGMLEAIADWRGRGYGVSLIDAQAFAHDKTILSAFSHLELPFDKTDLATQAKLYGAMKQSPTRLVARQLGSWQDFDACTALGLDAFVGKMHLTPRADVQSKGLNAGQAVILQLMRMVQQNAPVRDLETVLKRDPTIAYKLLRYINSPAIGLRTEVESLRHAVTLLGYSPLYRWLALLLATSSNAGYSPVLMHTAIVRGRFAELLGVGTLGAREAENLFVAGMFSLLDRLIGMPMDALLEQVVIADEIKRALLSREGAYGPYLALAEACELNSALVGSLAASLQIDADTVNATHLAALAWTNGIGVS